MKIISSLLAVSTLVLSFPVFSKNPDCTGPERWPSRMAFVYLKNAEILGGDTFDYDAPKVVRLASEKIGKDRYRQVHRVTFVKKTGEPLTVITVNDVSHEECSVSGVDVYVVSKYLGDTPEQK